MVGSGKSTEGSYMCGRKPAPSRNDRMLSSQCSKLAEPSRGTIWEIEVMQRIGGATQGKLGEAMLGMGGGGTGGTVRGGTEGAI